MSYVKMTYGHTHCSTLMQLLESERNELGSHSDLSMNSFEIHRVLLC